MKPYSRLDPSRPLHYMYLKYMQRKSSLLILLQNHILSGTVYQASSLKTQVPIFERDKG